MTQNLEPDRDRPITELKPENYNKAIDLRGEPTHVCVCGCFIWNIKCAFQDYEMAYYYLDMECANCGSLATAPTPSDMPEDYIPTGECCPDDEEDCDNH
jgi:hypothetical protein